MSIKNKIKKGNKKKEELKGGLIVNNIKRQRA